MFSVLYEANINPTVVCVHSICVHTKTSNGVIKVKDKCNILTFDIFNMHIYGYTDIICVHVCIYIYMYECIYAYFYVTICVRACVSVYA